jgi:hypothetical protein
MDSHHSSVCLEWCPSEVISSIWTDPHHQNDAYTRERKCQEFAGNSQASNLKGLVVGLENFLDWETSLGTAWYAYSYYDSSLRTLSNRSINMVRYLKEFALRYRR